MTKLSLEEIINFYVLSVDDPLKISFLNYSGLQKTLSSNHLLLRKAAVSCLRQLAQREAREVCEHALILINESDTDDGNKIIVTVVDKFFIFLFFVIFLQKLLASL